MTDYTPEMVGALGDTDTQRLTAMVAINIELRTRIEELEAEIHRLHYFAGVIEEHAENIKTEAAIALHPQVKVDVVKDGSIAYPSGHGPTDPPRPVQRHE